MFATLAVLSLSFVAPPAPALVSRTAQRVGVSPACVLSDSSVTSRRAAIATGAASLAALATLPTRAAFADENEDAMARIAAKTNAANEAEKERQRKKVAKAGKKAERENAGASVLVTTVGGAAFFLSLPFFYKNLGRLFLKQASVVNKNIDPRSFRR